jgi:uncharacterized membrane protein YdfJ with MMPL/SSD domain
MLYTILVIFVALLALTIFFRIFKAIVGIVALVIVILICIHYMPAITKYLGSNAIFVKCAAELKSFNIDKQLESLKQSFSAWNKSAPPA